MPSYSLAIYRSNANPIKIPTQFFMELEKISDQFEITTKKKHKIAKTILNNNRPCGRINIHHLKLYYRAILMKTAWYWNKDSQVVRWNGTENTELNPHTYGHLIFDKKDKTIQWKKDSIFIK